VVVVAPDLLQDPGAAPLPEVARGLAEAGFLVAAYGAPASRARETTFATALEDLKTVTDVLFERAALDGGLGERVDNHRIGVLGHGLGGAVAVAHARRDTRLRAVVAAAAPGSPSSLFTRRELDELAAKGWVDLPGPDGKARRVDARLVTEWRARASEYDLAPSAEALSAPVLFVHGTADERTPIDDARAAYYRQSRHGRLLEVEGGDHAFRGPAAATLVEAAAGFFREVLLGLAMSA
jgi:fermentation-respiration switch protein FrsA (DUF1100 family)